MRSSRRRLASVPHLSLLLIVLALSALTAGTATAATKSTHAATAKTTVKKAVKKSAKKSSKKTTKKVAAKKSKKSAKSTARESRKIITLTRRPTPGRTTTTTTTSAPAPSTTTTTTTTAAPAPAASTPVASTGAVAVSAVSQLLGTVDSSIATAAGYNGFGGVVQPAATWRPYSDSSPFNQLVTSAAVAPRSAQVVSRVLSWSAPANLTAGAADTTDDYAHPVFYSQPSDPIVTLHATEPWGRASIEGMQIRVPANARPAGGSDAHLTIVTPDGWEYDLWEATKPANGALNFGWGGRTRVDGNGLNTDGTAARFGNLAGIIRPEELAAGRINHALFIVLKCTSTSTSYGLGTQAPRSGAPDSAYIYPASKGGSNCPSSETDAPPMGTRFRLNMTDAQIQALNVPTWKKTVLTAFAHYGGYVGDTGGPGFGFQFESGTSYTAYGQKDPFVTYAQKNNLPTWQGKYVYGMPNDVNWAQYLQAVAPPAAS